VRVLVADDQAVVRRGLRRLLELAGITVVAEAANGLEAVHLSMQHRPDALVLDIEMPKLNGFEVVARLRALALQPAIVVLSGHDEEAYVLRAVKMEVRGYLVKSALDEDLVPAIHAVADGRSFYSPGRITRTVERYRHRATKSLH
jgi:DNA-binding NarL/FixJ family response regulator